MALFGKSKMERAKEAAAQIDARRWGKLKSLSPGERRVENTPAMITALVGHTLDGPAGGYVFATDQAVHFAIETWLFGSDPGPLAPYEETLRLAYSDIASLSIKGFTVRLTNSSGQDCAAELYPSPLSARVTDAIRKHGRR